MVYRFLTATAGPPAIIYRIRRTRGIMALCRWRWCAARWSRGCGRIRSGLRMRCGQWRWRSEGEGRGERGRRDVYTCIYMCVEVAVRAGSLLYTTFRLFPSTVHQVTPFPPLPSPLTPPSALHTGIHDIPARNSMLLHDRLRSFVPLAPPHKRADRPQLHLRLESAQIEPVTLNLPD